MKRILCTGANGMLGEAVAKVFKNHILFLTDIDTLDVRNPMNPIVLRPDCILHLAALTDLEECEAFPSEAFHTNTIGTQNMVEVAKKLKIPIVYISTAGVFDGKKEEYVWNDEPNPINMYGLSKYYGELAVKAYERHYIIRISWAFGGGDRDKKFVKKILQQIDAGDTDIYALDRKYGSPSYTKDVAKRIHSMITSDEAYGTYHLETGKASRFAVAKEIVKVLGCKVKVHIAGERMFPMYDTPRPKYEVLQGLRTRNWKIALKEYLYETVTNKSIA